MDKISENLEKIFTMDRQRIKQAEGKVKAQIAKIKKLKADREKLAKEWEILAELRKTDLVEFEKARNDYDEKAEAAIVENAKFDEDIKTGKINWAEHKEKRRQPENIRDEWRKRFWKDWDLTLDAARGRHVEILKLEARIAEIDFTIIRIQDSIYISEEEMVKKKLDDIKRFHPGFSRVLGAADEAKKRDGDKMLAEGKSAYNYILDIKSSEDLFRLPIDARFKKEHLNMVYVIIEKYRDFDFSDSDRIHLNYLPYKDYTRDPCIDDAVLYSAFSRKANPNRGIVKIDEKTRM